MPRTLTLVVVLVGLTLWWATGSAQDTDDADLVATIEALEQRVQQLDGMVGSLIREDAITVTDPTPQMVIAPFEIGLKCNIYRDPDFSAAALPASKQYLLACNAN